MMLDIKIENMKPLAEACVFTSSQGLFVFCGKCFVKGIDKTDMF